MSATELARKLGDVLGRVRYRKESFVIERNGKPIARISPWPAGEETELERGLRAWMAAGGKDNDFADDLERVNRSDRPARDPWASS